MDEEQKRNNPNGSDRFSRFMFGPNREIEEKTDEQQTIQIQSTIDYEEIMNNIDSLMESAKNLKPVLQKVYLFVGQIWKKK